MPLVVGYHNEAIPYKIEALVTIRSCIKFGLDHHTVGVSNLRVWQKNTWNTAQFKLDCLEKFPDK
ncbi:MAG: hypothetical protein D8M57_19985 [Candidatus Scalindua sp. AMX11]|nr:MAG: hypothetical protein D8M57_19985 [Candidatus Scalindua sp. AMX11]